MSVSLFNKRLVICIFLLFLCSTISPCFSVVSQEIEVLENINDSTEAFITCYVFDKSGNCQRDVILSSEDFTRFSSMYKSLNLQIANSPFSTETEIWHHM